MIEPLQTTLPNRLFVYGTLMTTAAHPMGLLLRNNGHRIGNGTIRARLYIIDDPDEPGLNFYPGALPSGSAHDKVHGELYELTAPELVLEQFDDYEACSARWPEPHEFLRRTVDVSMQDGQILRAITYLYTWDVSTARHIPSGRFSEAAPNVR